MWACDPWAITTVGRGTGLDPASMGLVGRTSPLTVPTGSLAKLSGNPMRHFAHSVLAAAAFILSITPARADTVQFLGYSHGSVGVNFQISGPQPTSGATGAG